MNEEQLKTLTDSELIDLTLLVENENLRRLRIKKEKDLLNQTQVAVLDDLGIMHEDGAAWTQPLGVHDAYLLAGTVLHNGKLWESLTPYNVWEPGVSGWREIVSGGGGVPVFVQPTGAHDAYSIGDEVMFEGTHYVSAINGNVWSPAAHPAGWTVVEA